jgi:hypothetical protein
MTHSIRIPIKRMNDPVCTLTFSTRLKNPSGTTRIAVAKRPKVKKKYDPLGNGELLAVCSVTHIQPAGEKPTPHVRLKIAMNISSNVCMKV